MIIDNKEIRDFVNRHIYTCHSLEIEEELKHGVIDYEDIENGFIDADKEYQDYGYNSPEDMRDDGADLKEIYEWWEVDKFLYNKLKLHNEPVIQVYNNYYWGRCGSGQAILLDNVIQDIFKEVYNEFK